MLRRRLPRAAVIWFVVAGGCAALAFVSVRDLAARAAAGEGVPTAPLVVVARDVDAGSLLGPDDLQVAEVAEPVPPGSLTDPAEAAGALAVTPFVAGEVVTWTRVAQPGSALAARIPPGLLGVTIAVGALPEGLSAGDRVDVLATFTSARPYTTSVASDVTVLHVPASGGTGFGAAAEGAEVLVLASPEVARQLVQANATGVLAVAVRGFEPLAVAPGDDR